MIDPYMFRVFCTKYPNKSSLQWTLPIFKFGFSHHPLLKMSISDVKKISEDELKTRLNELIDVNNYLDGCVTCSLPHLLHKGTTCTRSSQAEV